MQLEQKRTGRIGTVVSLALLLALTAACPTQPEVVILGRNGSVRVPVELALTTEQRARGLMYRTDLPKGSGMLFVFPRNENHTFWMKNTPLPLDMIFIDDTRTIIGFVENAVPFSLETRGVDRQARLVLEVHAGFVERHDLRVGDRVELPDLSVPRS